MLAALAAMAADGGAVRKKVIACGWGFNNVTVDDFLSNAEKFDQIGINGVLVWMRGKDGKGRPVGMRNIYGEDWEYGMFAPMVPKLRLMKEHAAFRDNFLITFRSPPARISWTNDAAWARLASNLRVAACIARDGGCRGLQMDCEDYHRAQQFVWRSGDPAYGELRNIARRRGAELFREAFREFPAMRVLSFWFLTMGTERYREQDAAAGAAARKDLWPAFVNGMLDVMPPEARLIEGNENAYHYDADRRDFYRSYHHVRRALLPLVEPENRERYARQMQVGFGMYLDMYVNPTNSVWYFPPKDGSRLETFRRNLDQALEVCDEYVWAYGEKLQFIAWPDGFKVHGGTSRERWEDRLPGFSEAIKSITDIDGFADRRQAELEAAGLWTNLVANGDCAVCTPGAVPKPFGFWQPGGNKANYKGNYGCDTAFGDGDSTSFCAEGVPEGCFSYTMKVKPGELYRVTCAACGDGASVSLAWRNANGRYLLDTRPLAFGSADGRWRRVNAAVRMPLEARAMQITLGVRLAPGEKAWFDNVGVFRLSR